MTMSLTDDALAKGQKRAAAKRRRIGADTDDRILRALAEGVPPDPQILSARLSGITYARARYSLIRLGRWEPRRREKN